MTADSGRPLHDLGRVLTLKEIDADTFEGASLDQPGGRTYGGQVLAQALLAAARTAPVSRLPHSVHGYFLRPGIAADPIRFAVDRLYDGGSFSTRRTHAIQEGVPILSMITSFQETQEGLEHAHACPDGVPIPEYLPSALDLLEAGPDKAIFWVQQGALDVRHYPREIYTGPGPAVTDRQYVWLKTRAELPDDELVHRAVLAFACDQFLFEPALRRHHLSWATEGLSLASLDHAMWWHRPVRVDEWLLFSQACPSAQGGRALGTAEVFTRDGLLVATIAQEGMFRYRGDAAE